jgi:hypothetical protein
MALKGRTFPFRDVSGNVRNRRISPVAAHSGDRLLSEPLAGTQPCREGSLVSSQSCSLTIRIIKFAPFGGRSTDNNVTALQFDCDGDPSRAWNINATGDGVYQIRNVQTGKCLTIAGGRSTARGETQ